MKQIFNFTSLLVVFNLVLLFLVFRGNPQTPITLPAPAQLDMEKLDLIAGEDIRQGPFGTLFIFINADADCDCLDDWGNWVDAYNQLKDDIAVVGVFNGTDLEKYVNFANSMELPFPIYADTTLAVRGPLRITREQVVKAYVDAQGNLIYMDSYQTSKKNQRYFLKRLREHVDRLNG